MESRAVEVSIRDTVATVSLNRPERGNALNSDMRVGIRDAITELDHQGVRVIVIRGKPDGPFASGADLAELDGMGAPEARAHFAEFEDTLDAIETTPLPVIAMVAGYAVGGGCELAAACDLRVSAESARWGMPLGRLGHTIDRRNIRRLLRLVSQADIKAMLFTDWLLSSHDAHRAGLVNWVVPDQELSSFTEKLAETVSRKAPLGVAAAKRSLLEAAHPCPSERPEDEDPAVELFESEDFNEGVRAFLERRAPSFIGS